MSNIKYIFSVVFLLITTHTLSQTNKATSAVGIHYLEGVGEVGSGFKLNVNHSFEFFFSYGALDRAATGTWVQHGDSIILNNVKKPPKDFKLVQSKQTGKKQVVIKIVDNNEMFVKNVYAQIDCPDTFYRSQSDQNGIITFDKCNVQRISLVHELWHERFSVFTIPTMNNDYFEFSIEPWIVDVDFDNFTLIKESGGLTGYHPLLEKKKYRYVKQH